MMLPDVDPTEIYNPIIHRLNHAITQRAISGKDSLPQTWPDVLSYTDVSDDIRDRAEPICKKLKTALDIKEVVKKPKVKAKEADTLQKTRATATGLDVDALLDAGNL
jgi:ATP-dependent DNA helicase 2 subunit 2